MCPMVASTRYFLSPKNRVSVRALVGDSTMIKFIFLTQNSKVKTQNHILKLKSYGFTLYVFVLRFEFCALSLCETIHFLSILLDDSLHFKNRDTSPDLRDCQARRTHQFIYVHLPICENFDHF